MRNREDGERSPFSGERIPKRKEHKKMKIDMWYGDTFEKKQYGADAFFYPHGCLTIHSCYAGNIYNEKGEAIGDYTTPSSREIPKYFQME